MLMGFSSSRGGRRAQSRQAVSIVPSEAAAIVSRPSATRPGNLVCEGHGDIGLARDPLS
jgi:hypothetical protein